MKRRVILTALFSGMLAVSGWALVQALPGSPSQEIFYSSRFTFTIQGTPTEQDWADYGKHRVYGTACPSTFVNGPSEGQVRGVLTGVAQHGTGNVQLVITVTDESADIDTAEVYMSGALVATATRANGGIVDRSGFGTATMAIWVPGSTATHTFQARWTSTTGYTRSTGVYVAP